MVLHTVAKSPGLPVLAPNGELGGDCLVARVIAAEPWRSEIAWPAGYAGGVLHRLDTSTSGAVAFASSLEEHAAVRQLFADGKLVKTYLFVAARNVSWNTNVCAGRLAHDPRRKSRMVVERGPNTPHRGRWLDAETLFRRVRGRLFEATITSGVMHQIRVHAAFLGLPLAGDRTYGGGATPEDAPMGAAFLLHHLGFHGPGVETAPVALPPWAVSEEPTTT